jgi:hypothetical protein
MANKPTNPSLWSKAKSLARQKFDVYPSAYANGWAAKWYKGKGGGWRKAANGGMIEDTEIAYRYGGDPSIPNLNYSDMYFYATGGAPNNPGFNALPEDVQMKIIANMKRYGGPSSMGYYQGDMGPSSVMGGYDMGDYNQFPEMDPMTGETYAYASQPMYVAPNLGYEQMGPLPAAAVQKYQAAIAAPKVKLSPYQGPSIVDFLNTQGLASDYKTRKQLAQVIGIPNYTGRADQNELLISTIINNPDVLSTVAKSSKKTTKASKKAVTPTAEDEDFDVQYTMDDYVADQAAANRFIMAPEDVQTSSSAAVYGLNDALAGKALGADSRTASSSNVGTTSSGKKAQEEGYVMGPQEAAAVIGLGVGSTIYLMNKLGKGWVANNAKYLNDLVRAGLSADDIIAAAKAGGRAEDTVKLLTNRGMSSKDALKALKNIKFKPTGSVSPQVIKGGEEAVARIKNLVEATEKARKQAAVVVQLMRDRNVRDPRSMAKLETLIPNTVERMKMLRGIPMPKLGVAEAAVNLGGKGLRLLSMSPIKKDGGSYMNMYQGDEGGSEYEGDVNYDNGDLWYSEQNERMPWWGELLDMSGVSSWDDLVRATKDPDASGWDVALEAFGVIPGIGKLGKAAKLAKEASQVSKTAKTAKELSTARKVLKSAGKVAKGAGVGLDWISGMAPLRLAQGYGKYNPLAMITRGVDNALEGSPKIIKLLNATSEASRIGKTGKALNSLVNNYMAKKEIIKQQPEELIKMYMDDGSIIEVGSHDPLFMEIVEKNALDTTGQRTDPTSGAIYLDTSKFAGPRDWNSVRKTYGKGKVYSKGGDTYSAGVFYDEGGTFIPTYSDMAYGVLPEYEMGSYYADGGMTGGDEMYVTPEQMEMLRQQGYDFDII